MKSNTLRPAMIQAPLFLNPIQAPADSVRPLKYH